MSVVAGNVGRQVERMLGTAQVLVPVVHRVGERLIEVTYLGDGSGCSTWILWNAENPNLIGMLRQADQGIVFEQSTGEGAFVYRNLSTVKLALMLDAGSA